MRFYLQRMSNEFRKLNGDLDGACSEYGMLLCEEKKTMRSRRFTGFSKSHVVVCDIHAKIAKNNTENCGIGRNEKENFVFLNIYVDVRPACTRSHDRRAFNWFESKKQKVNFYTTLFHFIILRAQSQPPPPPSARTRNILILDVHKVLMIRNYCYRNDAVQLLLIIINTLRTNYNYLRDLVRTIMVK